MYCATSDQNATLNSLLNYVLDSGVEDPMTLLRMWREGQFSEIRSEWPEVPEAIFPKPSQTERKTV